MIDNWLASKDRNDILLEEAVREELSLTDLWPGAEHTQRLKKLNKNNTKIKPVDIRPLLIPFSWELLSNKDSPSEQANMTLDNYLILIDKIFNFRSSKLMMKYIVPEMKKLNINNKYQKLLLEHFDEIKEIYKYYREDNKIYLNKTIKEIYNINQSLLEEINEMISMLMEWYILLLVLNSDNNSILHMGLAHSNRILEFLIEVYSFEIIKKSGINMMAEINDEPNACLLIPDEINNKFK